MVKMSDVQVCHQRPQMVLIFLCSLNPNQPNMDMWRKVKEKEEKEGGGEGEEISDENVIV